MAFSKNFDYFSFTILSFVILVSVQSSESAHDKDVPQSQNEKIPVEEILISDEEDFYEEVEENFFNDTNLAPINIRANVRFYLYTRDNPSSEFRIITGDKERLQKSPFKPNLPVKILIHGFGGNTSHRYPTTLKDAYLKTSKDLNVILVDWSVLAAKPFYDRAVYNTVPAGEETAKLITFLITAKMSSLDQIHIIGHSLGAHVAGIAGSQVDSTLGHKIPRITGLDPARPAFEIASRKRSLDKSDAKFVDIIHSSLLGLYRVVGHVDFYPNKGLFQPGCLHFDLSCSHSRSHEMFTKALYYPRSMRGCRCLMNDKNMVGQIPRIIPRRCVCHEKDETTVAFMGNMHDKQRGVFYLETGQREKAYEVNEEMF